MKWIPLVVMLGCGEPKEPGAEAATSPPHLPVATLTQKQLGAELALLESEVRERGTVRDADLRRGTAAIEAARLDPERTVVELRAFGERFSLLRAQLAHAPVTEELARLGAKLEASKPEAHPPLIAKYRVVASRLPQRERLDALERLKRFETRRGVTR